MDGVAAVELYIRPSTASTLHFPPPMARKPLALVFDTSAEGPYRVKPQH